MLPCNNCWTSFERRWAFASFFISAYVRYRSLPIILFFTAWLKSRSLSQKMSLELLAKRAFWVYVSGFFPLKNCCKFVLVKTRHCEVGLSKFIAESFESGFSLKIFDRSDPLNRVSLVTAPLLNLIRNSEFKFSFAFWHKSISAMVKATPFFAFKHETVFLRKWFFVFFWST